MKAPTKTSIMQEETFKNRLDLYYLATIGYGITLAAYVIVRGTLIGDKFEVVWQDPIVYLLALCSVISLIGVIVATITQRTVIVGDRQLTFRTRFKERVFNVEDIEWIGFRRERGYRKGRAYPMARIQLRSRRRPLRLRFGAFERAGHLARSIRDFAVRNNVDVRVGKRRKRNDE